MAQEFHGRRAELQLLDSLRGQSGASMLVLYGRRRIGKTRLLTHWAARVSTRACYWVAEPTSSADQLRAFSQTIFNLGNPDSPAPPTFTYADWRQAFQQVGRLAEHQPLALIIDEFTDLLESVEGIAGLLQNVWDHSLSATNLMLVISGSHMGMMNRHVLSRQSPLFGRATAQLQLRPLPFGLTPAFFPAYTPSERVAVYAVFGGVPAYWERIDPARSFSDNLRRLLLTAGNPLHDEPRMLLHDFVNEPHNYVAALRAIANGARTQKDIAGQSGLAQGHVSKYLSVLREAGFIDRRVSLTAAASSRSGRYHIVDPYLRFYYRFLATRQAQLAIGFSAQAETELRRHLRDFIGTHTWEELCREWLLRASATDALPFVPDQVGSIWTKSVQVDVAGINSMERTMILGECKWGGGKTGSGPLRELVEKTTEVVPTKGTWKVYHLGFARTGWTAAAERFDIDSGPSWTSVGLRTMTLDAVDADLQAWSV